MAGPYLYILVMLGCATTFSRAARLEDRSPLLWGGLSLAAWLGTTMFLGGGYLMGFLSQVGLFVLLTVVYARELDGEVKRADGRKLG